VAVQHVGVRRQDVAQTKRASASSLVLLLFNDKLMLCARKKDAEGQQLVWRKEAQLFKLVVFDTDPRFEEHDKAFILERPGADKKSWVLFFAMSNEKQMWFKLLRQHIGHAKLARAIQQQQQLEGETAAPKSQQSGTILSRIRCVSST